MAVRTRRQPLAAGGWASPARGSGPKLLGGTLTAGPGPGGGFVVIARLPVQPGREALPAEKRKYGLTGEKSQEGLN